LRVKPPLEMCKHGLHASKRLVDALTYAPGTLVCRVELGGEIIYAKDKMVAMERTILWIADATNTLHEFACWCAENALHVANVTDERSWNAIKTKRAWLAGEVTDSELAAARAAAGVAAGAAARAAAGGAAEDAARAAAGDAAEDAARAAAGAAAWDAAWDAARAAARAAAEDAARAAAWDAAGAVQNKKLTNMVNRLRDTVEGE